MSRNGNTPRMIFSQRADIFFLPIGLVLFAAHARGAEWTERPYDPPVGSRWLIEAKQSNESDAAGRTQASDTTAKSELAVEQKLADGFRVTYVTRDSTFVGDARAAAIVGPAAKALDNIVIRATLAANGLPLRIENLDELLTAAHAAIDHFTASLGDNPQVTAVAGKLMTGMLIANADRAPQIYLSSLVLLAAGQNTGLLSGETRNSVEDAPNPLTGAAIKSNTSLRIDSADASGGNVHYVRTRTYDPEAMKALLGNVLQQMGVDPDNAASQNLADLFKQMSLALESHTEFDVEQGITRSVKEDDAATTTILGQKIVKHVHKQLTVTPAQ